MHIVCIWPEHIELAVEILFEPQLVDLEFSQQQGRYSRDKKDCNAQWSWRRSNFGSELRQ